MLYNIMPENLYPQLPTAPPMSQESFNIEMARKYYQDIANLNPISTGLFCLVVALGGGGVFHPPSITPLSLKLDCSNFVRRYFQIG